MYGSSDSKARITKGKHAEMYLKQLSWAISSLSLSWWLALDKKQACWYCKSLFNKRFNIERGPE